MLTQRMLDVAKSSRIINPEAIDAYVLALAKGNETVLSLIHENLIWGFLSGAYGAKPFYSLIPEPLDAPEIWPSGAITPDHKTYSLFDPALIQADEKLSRDLTYVVDWFHQSVADGSRWVKEKVQDGGTRIFHHVEGLAGLVACADFDMAKRRALKKLHDDALYLDQSIAKDVAEGLVAVAEEAADGWKWLRLNGMEAAFKYHNRNGTSMPDIDFHKQANEYRDADYYVLCDDIEEVQAILTVMDGELLCCRDQNDEYLGGETLARAKAFILKNTWKIEADIGECGLFYDETGKIYDIENLPEGFSYEGDLAISDYKRPFTFPAGTSIDGDLDITNCAVKELFAGNALITKELSVSNCPDLTQFSSAGKLLVWRGISANDCWSLSSLAPEIKARDMYVGNCPRLKTLGDDVWIRDYLSLGDWTGLEEVPSKFHVGGPVSWNKKDFGSLHDFVRAFEASSPEERRPRRSFHGLCLSY